MAMDRITLLPDHLLHHLLCFLELEDFARISVLSKAWNRIWLSASIFDFNLHFYYDHIEDNPSLKSSIRDDKIHRAAQEEYLNSIDESLRRRLLLSFSVSVVGMWINIPTFEVSVPFMDRWMDTTIQSNLQKLELKISVDDDSSYKYRPPQILLSAKSLTVLELYDCTLDSNCDIKLSQLRKQDLRYVCLLDEKMLSNLAFNFPLIEDLVLRNCQGLKNLRLVPELSQLKHVDIDLWYLSNNNEVQCIEITVPHLCTLSFEGRRRWDRISFGALKELKLREAIWITDEKFQNLMSNLPELEKMTMIHEKLSEFQPSKLRYLKNAFSNIHICISSKSLAELVSAAFWYDTKNLSVAWSISNPKQVLFDKVQQGIEMAARSREYEFEDSQEAEDEMNPAWKFFIKSHLIALYKVTTFRIKWKPLEQGAPSHKSMRGANNFEIVAEIHILNTDMLKFGWKHRHRDSFARLTNPSLE
ncbi:unnamed protein product [Ilex paraguariensis]|uniref:F-box domain-containing protein n=1 Tax=Ilex paraguariensis TaxID=185542 RepID=A0ABC8TYF3_9AQUA